MHTGARTCPQLRWDLLAEADDVRRYCFLHCGAVLIVRACTRCGGYHLSFPKTIGSADMRLLTLVVRGHTYQETGKVLNLTKNAVRERLRAIRRLAGDPEVITLVSLASWLGLLTEAFVADRSDIEVPPPSTERTAVCA